MKMVERMAVAMSSSKAWPVVFDAGRSRVLALAALKAMREPTDTMCAEPGPSFDEAACIEAERVWQTMIDAAIREAEGE